MVIAYEFRLERKRVNGPLPCYYTRRVWVASMRSFSVAERRSDDRRRNSACSSRTAL